MRIVASVLLGVVLITPNHSDTQEIDSEQSAITIQVDKTGWFSSFGDRHVVHAPIAHGWINGSSRPAVEFQVESKRLTVLDPNLSIDGRREVQQRMLRPAVLDADRHTGLHFRSTAINAVDDNHWKVTGDLTLHGVTRSIAGDVSMQAGRYFGLAGVRQRD